MKKAQLETKGKEESIGFEGKVIDKLPGDSFKIDIGDGHTITAYPSGKLRVNHIQILVGDTVAVEISPYDTTKGRIVWRYK